MSETQSEQVNRVAFEAAIAQRNRYRERCERLRAELDQARDSLDIMDRNFATQAEMFEAQKAELDQAREREQEIAAIVELAAGKTISPSTAADLQNVLAAQPEESE